MSKVQQKYHLKITINRSISSKFHLGGEGGGKNANENLWQAEDTRGVMDDHNKYIVINLQATWSKSCRLAFANHSLASNVLLFSALLLCTARWSTVEGTTRVLWCYCDRMLRSYCTCSSCWVPHSTLNGTATCSSHCIIWDPRNLLEESGCVGIWKGAVRFI